MDCKARGAEPPREELRLLVVLVIPELSGRFSIADARWSGIESSSEAASSPSAADMSVLAHEPITEELESEEDPETEGGMGYDFLVGEDRGGLLRCKCICGWGRGLPPPPEAVRNGDGARE